MGLPSIISEINGDFGRKSKFSHPHVFCASAKRVPFGIGYQRLGSKNLTNGATGPRKKFDDIFSSVDTNVTDRRTPDDSKERCYA